MEVNQGMREGSRAGSGPRPGRSLIGRQFGHPQGPLGRVVGHFMARANARFNLWAVHQLHDAASADVRRVVELGPGPGIGLAETLRVFPRAHVWGVDLSPEMLSQARRRNLGAVRAGRLTLVEADAASLSELAELAPADVVLAVHVLYFWHRPEAELARIRGVLRPGGLLALGFQLRQHMPRPAQANFPKEGHLLYDSPDDVTRLLRHAGFRNVTDQIKGRGDAPEGCLMLATA